MAARSLDASDIGLPHFTFVAGAIADVFELESHRRAREALDFGLSFSEMGFNIFVVGEDRARRMTATLGYLAEAVAKRPPQDDWIYLNNFRDPARPTPHRLPAGLGRRFRDRLAGLVPHLREALAASFAADAYQARLVALREEAQAHVAGEVARLRTTAQAHGMQLAEAPDGGMRLVPAEAAAGAPMSEAAERELAAGFASLQRHAVEARTRLTTQVETLARATVEAVASLLVDHADDGHPLVVLEGNPTYENLFGRIEYHQAQGSIETDFTLIRAGALHRANGGGVLVLRAAAIGAM